MTPGRSARTGKHRAADVCAELGIQPYVLKFWEAEIPELGERVGEDRLYGKDELALAKRIRVMVEEQRLGLGEVRSRLGGKSSGGRRKPAAAKRASESPRARVEHLEEELRSLRTIRADHQRLQREVEKLRRELVEMDGLGARRVAAAPDGLRGDVEACLEDARHLAAELDDLLAELKT